MAAWLALALLPGSSGAVWQPAVGEKFNYQLGKAFKPPRDFVPGVTIYFVDGADTPADVVSAIAARGTAVCYFSAGSWEQWREDAGAFPEAVKGKVMGGWPDENWLDIRSPALKPIMAARMQACKDKGFLAVDPDNVDGYTNDSGFPLTAQDQIAYNTWLADTAHAMGLAIGLKNDLDQLTNLTSKFEFFVNEQCQQYQECGAYAPVKAAGKPVFNIEYRSSRFNRLCICADTYGITPTYK